MNEEPNVWTCTQCGSQFERSPNRAIIGLTNLDGEKRYFCSVGCRTDWFAEEAIGGAEFLNG